MNPYAPKVNFKYEMNFFVPDDFCSSQRTSDEGWSEPCCGGWSTSLGFTESTRILYEALPAESCWHCITSEELGVDRFQVWSSYHCWVMR
jgi:hypothetical protein